MNLSTLEASIEAILFSMGEAVDSERIAVAIEQDAETTRKIIRNMMDRYEAEDRGIMIIEMDGAFQMCTKPAHYDCLKKLGIDVRFRLPSGDDAYGLSIQAVDDFEKEFGSLIITVDCGISNNREIAHAVSKGMDVIVTDHHNPPEELPENCIIVNPKIENSGYPFKDISGCAVAYKIASALRFSESPWYKTEATLLNVRPVNEAYTIECIKIRNLVPVSRLDETIVPGTISISQTRLPSYLQGQAILVWDKSTTEKLMKQVFGKE